MRVKYVAVIKQHFMVLNYFFFGRHKKKKSIDLRWMCTNVQQKYYFSEVQHSVSNDFIELPAESTEEEFLTRVCVIQ